MKTLIGLAIALTAVSASAQTTVAGIGMNAPNSSTFQSGVAGRSGIAETPTMRADKLKRAIALRTEVSAWIKQDGGRLSPGHERYVQRKACQILGTQGATTGSLVPPRRCSL
ncbi:hypothetical protein [Sphingomonas sp. PAMC 26605]|uniref:hypothetical protein n=1 Tax=Sphingomonas sp. PAMC 26605 TaxID=1112214 RepID=UPI00026CAC5D|nr:hypothetical protein [Sphingomonas sp. PAMC 26605]